MRDGNTVTHLNIVKYRKFRNWRANQTTLEMHFLHSIKRAGANALYAVYKKGCRQRGNTTDISLVDRQSKNENVDTARVDVFRFFSKWKVNSEKRIIIANLPLFQ